VNPCRKPRVDLKKGELDPLIKTTNEIDDTQGHYPFDQGKIKTYIEQKYEIEPQ
jgi:hypothetical protein